MSVKEVRLRFSVKLCTIDFGKSQHRLHLLVSKEDASLVGFEEKECVSGVLTVCHCNESGGSKTESNPTSASSLALSSSGRSIKSTTDASVSSEGCNNASSQDRQIFVQVWVTEDTVATLPVNGMKTSTSSGSGIKDLQLMCSDTFQEYYDIQKTSELFFRQVDLFPLQKIIFSVSDREAFKWLQKYKFCNGLLIQTCNYEILVSKGDVLLSSYPEVFLNDEDFQSDWFFKMNTLECLPLEHGKMGLNTQIIIFYEEAIMPRPNSRIINLSPSKNIFISDFCSSISFDETSAENTSLGGKKNTDHPKYLFEATIIENHIAWRKILASYDVKESIDLHSVIGVSRTLMMKYGFFDGTLLKVSMVPEDEPHLEQSPTHRFTTPSDYLEPDRGLKPREKLVMVKSLQPDLHNCKTVFISPVVLFNLHPGPVLKEKFQLMAEKIVDLPLESDVDEGCQSLSSSWSIGLPIASRVDITFINSPYYSPQTSYSLALKKYFKTPRLISVGDVFSVLSSDDPEFWQSITSDTGIRFPTIFFKVERIESTVPGYVSHVVDCNKTALLQKGTAHSYVPKISFYYLSNIISPYWNRLYCPGLNDYVKKLESSLLPFVTQRPTDKHRITVSPTILLSGPVGCGKMTVIECATLRLSLHIQQVNCHDLIGDTSAATEARIKNCFTSASLFSPCALVLKNIHALDKERTGQREDPRVVSSFRNSVKQMAYHAAEYPVAIIATTTNLRSVSEDMQGVFLHDIKMESPSETNRFDIIEALIDDEPLEADLSIKHLAQRTAGFVLGDLVCLVAHARREAYSSTLKLCCKATVTEDTEEDLVAARVILQQKHFEAALDKIQDAHSDAIGAPKIPNVSWEDVGGLSSVKSDILDTVQLPLQHPQLLAAGLKRSGVLLYGPPGTGKTLLAKAVATECSLNFLSVKGPELINMYVGQSEENIREVFSKARSATPCVIFFDELDSLAPNRGKSADSGGVMDRVVSQLLAELDGLGKSSDVFVIGATNRPDLLDPALLRPGRFDKLLYLGISEDRGTQLKILKALTRKFHIAKTCNLESVVSQCPWNMSGADFYALSSDAMLNALKRKIQQLEDGMSVDKSNIVVQEKDFLDALKTLVPSVSESELDRYKKIRDSLDVPAVKTPTSEALVSSD